MLFFPINMSLIFTIRKTIKVIYVFSKVLWSLKEDILLPSIFTLKKRLNINIKNGKSQIMLSWFKKSTTLSRVTFCSSSSHVETLPDTCTGWINEVTGVRTLTQTFTLLPAGSHCNSSTIDSLSLPWCTCNRAWSCPRGNWAVNAPLLLLCRALVSGLTVLFLNSACCFSPWCPLLLSLKVSTAFCSFLVTSALFVSFRTKEMNGLLYLHQLELSEPT